MNKDDTGLERMIRLTDALHRGEVVTTKSIQRMYAVSRMTAFRDLRRLADLVIGAELTRATNADRQRGQGHALRIPGACGQSCGNHGPRGTVDIEATARA